MGRNERSVVGVEYRRRFHTLAPSLSGREAGFLPLPVVPEREGPADLADVVILHPGQPEELVIVKRDDVGDRLVARAPEDVLGSDSEVQVGEVGRRPATVPAGQLGGDAPDQERDGQQEDRGGQRRHYHQYPTAAGPTMLEQHDHGGDHGETDGDQRHRPPDRVGREDAVQRWLARPGNPAVMPTAPDVRWDTPVVTSH